MRAKIGDFDLARPQQASDNGGFTDDTTKVMGTRLFMPPEAFLGTVSLKWDIFSFGVVS